eukprot:12903091-Ditylum_brightwellii.AAC.1
MSTAATTITPVIITSNTTTYNDSSAITIPTSRWYQRFISWLSIAIIIYYVEKCIANDGT